MNAWLLGGLIGCAWLAVAITLGLILGRLIYDTDDHEPSTAPRRGGSTLTDCGCRKHNLKPGCPRHDPQLRRAAA